MGLEESEDRVAGGVVKVDSKNSSSNMVLKQVIKPVEKEKEQTVMIIKKMLEQNSVEADIDKMMGEEGVQLLYLEEGRPSLDWAILVTILGI